MIKEEFKRRVWELRKEGKSYNSIRKELKVSKSTLSYWFQYLDWSREIKNKNVKEVVIESTNRIILMNEARRVQLTEKYKKAEVEAYSEFDKYKNNSVFIAGLMLYLGEGDKTMRNGQLRMGNVDAYVLKIFIKFLIIFCNVNKEKIRFWLLCYPDHDVKKCLNWWAKSLNMSNDQFYKTQVIQGRHKEKKLLYGVGNITISGTFLKTKVLKWIEIMSKNLAAII